MELTEKEEQLLRIIFKLGETLIYETDGFITDNGNWINGDVLYELEQKLGIYEIVD